jgi:replicative DNA helicase
MSRDSQEEKTNIMPYVRQVITKIENNYKNRPAANGFSTGFKDVDSLTGGLSSQTMWVLTGRPGMGKTSFAANIATHASIREKKKVAIFTSDHTASDITSRMIAAESKINHSHLKRGLIQDSAWMDLINSASSIGHTDSIDLFESTWLSIPEIRSYLEKGQYDLVIVDKFHSLILREEAAEGSNNRINELNQSAIELKGIARELNLTILLICDINKGQEQKVDKRPLLTDLKDFGGVLESYADIVVGIYRPEVHDSGNPNIEGVAEAIALKNRFGPKAFIKLHFDERCQRFSDKISTESPPAPMRPAPPPPMPRPFAPPPRKS